MDTSDPKFVANDSNDQNINNYLNDDCLLRIFQNLSLEERIKIELVCERWNYLSKLSWNNVRCFKIDQENFFEKYYGLISTVRTEFFINYLERSINYLNNVNITYPRNIKCCWSRDDSEKNKIHENVNLILNKIIREITQKCQNIQDLTLIDWGKNLSDENLKMLYSRNSKLENIYINYLQVKGECFVKLNPNSVKKLNISNFYIEGTHYFYDFLSKVTNLNVLEICDCRKIFNSVKIIQALIKSKCENISELNLSLKFEQEDLEEILSEFICKQKNFCSLTIPDMQFTQAFMSKLPAETLKTLSLCLDNFDRISHFKNLIKIACKINSLTDKCAFLLSECSNLECIDIHLKSTYLLTSVGEAYFSSYQNLTKFKFSFKQDNGLCLDNLLKAVSQCENIKEIHTKGCIFTGTGLSHISLLQNLEILNIPGAHAFTDEDLIRLVRNALQLKVLDLNSYKTDSLELLVKWNKLKTERGDRHILHIHSGDLKTVEYYMFETQALASCLFFFLLEIH